MAKIVIIGAGLTGLSAAYHLEKRGFYDYALFEKDSTVGGLCRSVQQDGFTFDYTGHLLHASDAYFQKLFADLVGIKNMNSIHRRSFIYSQNTYTDYPFQINLHGLPIDTIVECIEGYAQRKIIKNPRSFYDWVLSTFGAGIAKHFFFPFQKKIFSYDLKKVSPIWTGRFVPKTSLADMIQGAIQVKKDAHIGYNSQFYYPKEGGINYWITKLAQAIKNPLYTEYEVTDINFSKKTVNFSNGESEPYEILINTMPLDTFITRSKEKPSTHFKKSLPHLLCNSVVNFNLGIQHPDLSEKHWIYFPEEKYPFYRIGFPHNFADSMAPEGCSSLYGEFSYINRSSKYISAQLHQALAKTKEVLKISDRDIVTEKNIHISHAYVIYTLWRQKNIPKLLKRLEEHNIYSVGRYGEWKYSSMQEAVLDGKKVVEKVTIMPAKQAYETPNLVITPSKQKEL